MEILTLISMSMQKKTLLNLDQMYLNVHYHLKHVSRFNGVCMSATPGYDKTPTRFCSVVVDFCLSLLPLWESVIVLCFVVRYFMSIIVLQSS